MYLKNGAPALDAVAMLAICSVLVIYVYIHSDRYLQYISQTQIQDISTYVQLAVLRPGNLSDSYMTRGHLATHSCRNWRGYLQFLTRASKFLDPAGITLPAYMYR